MELGKRIMPQHIEDREGFFAPLAKKQKPYQCIGCHVPPGWLDCPAYGKLIDCILPSKVPLGETFDNYILPCNRYSFQKTYEGRILGLVIDLTNENGYYSVLELNLQNIKHVKIPCKGGVDSVPDNESVNLFVNEIRKFLADQQQQKSKKYVLVHCNHGHNRTGYMIVHYLMRTRLISVTQAIKIFADARPQGIYKSAYIHSLYEFYHEIKPGKLVCPPKPEWKGPAEFDLNADAADDSGLGMARLKISPPRSKKEPMKNDDVIGDSIPFDQEYTLRNICYVLLKLPVGGGKKRNLQFPGSCPMALIRGNMELLRQQCYYATWNAVGTRYMMLITSEGCYLIDRKFHFRRVQMRFPSVLAKPHHLTLLDGEMVIDTVNGSGKQVRRYLIYDIMAINSISLVERQFYERWEIIDKDVIHPRNHERKHIKGSKNPDYRYDLEPFRVRRKDFWLLSTVPNLLKELIPKLSHKADGLIFQGWLDPYLPYKNEWLLKWKNAENTVDFLYELVEDDHLLYAHDKGEKKVMAANRIIFQQDFNPSLYSGKIIQCYWNGEKQMWICIGIRSDKISPIEYKNYLRVARRIRDSISEDMLVKEIGRIISLPNYAGRTTTAKTRQ